MGAVAAAPARPDLLRIARGQGRGAGPARLAWLQLDEQAGSPAERCVSGWSAPQEAHGTALAAHDAELVGVWGRDPAKTEAVRASASGFTDLDLLLAERRGGHGRPPAESRPSWPCGRRPPDATCCSTSPWPCPWTAPTRWPGRWPPAGSPRWSSSPCASCPSRLVEAAAGGWGDVFTEPAAPPDAAWRRAPWAAPTVLTIPTLVPGPAAAGTGSRRDPTWSSDGAAPPDPDPQQQTVPAATQARPPALGARAAPPFELAHTLGEAIRYSRPWSRRAPPPTPVTRLGANRGVLDAAERFFSARTPRRCCG